MISNKLSNSSGENMNINSGFAVESKSKGEEEKAKREKLQYHNWFMIHSGLQKERPAPTSITKEKEEKRNSDNQSENNLQEKEEIKAQEQKEKRDAQDYISWFEKHKTKTDPILFKQWQEEEENFTPYTSICTQYYPLIFNPVTYPDYIVHKNNICEKHSQKKCAFCFTCLTYLCPECIIEQNNIHNSHSIINLDELKIDDKELLKEENELKSKIPQLDKEIIRFNNFIINSYRK